MSVLSMLGGGNTISSLKRREMFWNIQMNQPELKLIPRVEAVNDYLDAAIKEIEGIVPGLPEKNNGWDELNAVFLNTIGIN